MRIAFIGGGAMGEAMISGIIKSGCMKAGAITVSDVNQARIRNLEELYGIKSATDNRKAVKGKEIVVLAIKPQVLASVTEELRGQLKKDQMVISIVAGAKVEAMRQRLAHDCLVMVMPNTPAQIGEGMSVWTATESVTPQQREITRTILAALGKELYVADEKYMDMATAVSGSGPAYIFLIIEALTDAAVHIGMPRDMALELVLQTMAGSTKLAQTSDKHVAELRNMVTSPGGTSTEGLLQLEKSGLRAIITQAVISAYEKAKKPR